MNQTKSNISIEKNLRDTKHNKKTNDLLLKLLAKQKVKANPFGVFRSETFPAKEIKPVETLNDTV
jgi:hypothetical protein